MLLVGREEGIWEEGGSADIEIMCIRRLRMGNEGTHMVRAGTLF